MTGFTPDANIAIIGEMLCVRKLQIAAIHRVPNSCCRGADIASRNLSVIGIDDKATKFVIIRITLLGRCVTTQTIFVL
jgi:hypothetical protein